MQHSLYKEVVIIGNGPSAITLSLLLSGKWPYYTGRKKIPNAILRERLQASSVVSILDKDLEVLSEGLEGRSQNPVSLLFDQLTHPNADIGEETESCLDWRDMSEHRLDHIVLGRGPPGGSWQTMASTVLTISLDNWMELPGFSFQDWQRLYRNASNKSTRAFVSDVADYYRCYVHFHALDPYFKMCNVTKVSQVGPMCAQQQQLLSGSVNPERIRRVSSASYEEPLVILPDLWQCDCNDVWEGNEDETEDTRDEVVDSYKFNCGDKYEVLEQSSVEGSLWLVEGETIVTDDYGNSNAVKSSYLTPNVVLATGAHDKANFLQVKGEDLPFVIHSLKDYEKLLSEGLGFDSLAPVLIVGAGLSAADAILAAKLHNIPVVHVFRRHVTDSNLIFNRLPQNMYPEYHKVYQMMKDGGANYSGYKAIAQYEIEEIRGDRCVRIRGVDGERCIAVSFVVVLIGTRADLSFLSHHNFDPSHSTLMQVDAFSHESTALPGVYGMGPLVGDNFVRFVQGGALAIAADIYRKRRK